MALKCDLTIRTSTGVDLSAAYVRMRKGAEYFDTGVNKAVFRLETFVSKKARDDGAQAFNSVGFLTPEVTVSFDPKTDTVDAIVARAYEAVKADKALYPEFVGAVDA